MYKIIFRFEEEGFKELILENQEAGQTLLEVALSNDVELHHNCGGVCSCTTCHLYIEKGMQYIDEMSKREKDYVQRAVKPAMNSRLGCQSLLNEGEGIIEILVPDQARLPDAEEYFG
jgi:2Fe-2S ferredoxin